MALRKSTTKDASISAAQSTTLVRNLFRVAFCSVAYIRNFFEDDCFQLSTVGTTRYHKIINIERDDTKCFVDLLEQGVLDALQKKYLPAVLLEVFEELLGERLGCISSEVFEELGSKKSKQKNAVKRRLLECYNFNVSYVDGKAQLALTANEENTSSDISKEQVKETIGGVLRSLMQHTSSLNPLPASRILSMKLLYTKNTPAEYEPPLFRKAPDEEACWFEETPSLMEAGAVKTPYHQLSMTIHAGNKTAGKVDGVHNGKTKEEDGKKVDKPGEPVKKAKNDRKLNEEWDQGTALIDVGSSNANSGQVGKRFLAESQDMETDGEKGHTFNLQRRESNIERKNASGDKDGEEEGKITGGTQSGKKRKASVAERDISKQ